jgi:hypothetical protein
MATTAFGQGQVAFNNTASTNFRLWTNNATGTASNLMTGASQYRIGLYGSTDLGASEGSLSLLLLATNAAPAALAGYFQGGVAAPIAGIAPGTTIRFQVRGWSLARGANWDEALLASSADPLNVAIGTSPFGTTTLGGGVVPPGAIFGTTPGALTSGFGIAPIPEPSSIALGLLGLGAIALFRRRK